MYVCVAYDISSNRLRLRVSKWCKKAGLLRMQRSVFAGKIAAAQLAELEQETRPLLAKTDQFAVMQLDKTNFHALLQQSTNARLQALAKPAVYWNL